MSTTTAFYNTDVDKDVVLQKSSGKAEQIWNFIRQDDGSYVIRNVGTDRYLDVHNFNDYDGGLIKTTILQHKNIL